MTNKLFIARFGRRRHQQDIISSMRIMGLIRLLVLKNFEGYRDGLNYLRVPQFLRETAIISWV